MSEKDEPVLTLAGAFSVAFAVALLDALTDWHEADASEVHSA